ncbi:Tn7 transposase TnsA N-terminal domain-containing protein [Vibrio vulnificus]|uniref:TnsA endonuclease N-terminal domain-containing protein n=1 Tax=Vibrio cidicii TaxID=1763883 RepID=A0A151JK57_9VIBR|nr:MULTISPECIES: TnsA endonuclease N-terminal domain-containing protein [Vibrio]KYN26145.1 hypothetical protein AUQ44_13400 [Vibrio cidicii]MCA3903874.1 Tn7 transposase TnsA N-terminal domain-containing protein [Vibrio vulnificus]HAS8506105.1 hypothetical protein [Vibrio vulnificus]
MYIRNLRKPSPNKNIYKFASSKNKQTILCEGSLERDCCYHFEYDSDVVSYESQPEGYYYEYDGKQLPYTPDFLVNYICGYCCFVENKPYGKTLSKEFKQKFESRRLAAKCLGFDLILVTDRQIRKGFFLENSRLVHRYSGCIDSDKLSITIYEMLSAFNLIKIDELAYKANLSISSVLAIVLKLVSQGKVWIDLDSARINETTLVEVR